MVLDMRLIILYFYFNNNFIQFKNDEKIKINCVGNIPFCI